MALHNVYVISFHVCSYVLKKIKRGRQIWKWVCKKIAHEILVSCDEINGSGLDDL